MDVKSRRKAEHKNKTDGNGAFVRVKDCPFCGSIVMTRIARSGTRFFDCPCCGASVTFRGANEQESIALWECRDAESRGRRHERSQTNNALGY